jgi:hypothetical protein
MQLRQNVTEHSSQVGSSGILSIMSRIDARSAAGQVPQTAQSSSRMDGSPPSTIATFVLGSGS